VVSGDCVDRGDGDDDWFPWLRWWLMDVGWLRRGWLLVAWWWVSTSPNPIMM